MSEANPFNYDVLIREFHLDTYGHVNNATYMALFEETRWELVNSYGLGLNKVMETRIGPIVLEARIKFVAEIHLRQKIKIQIFCVKLEDKLAYLEQKMIGEDGTIHAKAEFKLGLFDMKQRKLIEISNEWKEALLNSKSYSVK